MTIVEVYDSCKTILLGLWERQRASGAPHALLPEAGSVLRAEIVPFSYRMFKFFRRVLLGKCKHALRKAASCNVTRGFLERLPGWFES